MDKNKILLICVSTLLVISVIFAFLKVADKKPENNALSSFVTSQEISDEQTRLETSVQSTAITSTSAYIYVASPSKTSSASSAKSSPEKSSVSSAETSSVPSVTETSSTVTTAAEKSSSKLSSLSSSSANNSGNSSDNDSDSSAYHSGTSSENYSSSSSGGQSTGSSSKIISTTTVSSSSHNVQTVTTTETEEPVTEYTTEETTQPAEEISVIDRIFSESGENIEDLGESRQLITVSSYGSYCDVSMYEKIDDTWQNVYNTYGIVGMNGVSEKSGEGDYRTPKGLFGLGFGFGTDEMSDLNIEYRQFNENCYWVDDPQSDYYNQWVESEDTSAWNSAEHLIEYPVAYHYAVVINYNMEAVKGAGSAIFLHCAVGNFTAGCVGIPEDGMFYVMHWLDSSKDPRILIY